jgi:uncharacterized protein
VTDRSLTGTVELICQRSLHPMPFDLGRRTPVLLASDQRELDAVGREESKTRKSSRRQPLELNALLEDEFLLSLPYAPLCDDPECAQTLQARNGGQPLGIAAQERTMRIRSASSRRASRSNACMN